MLRNLKTPLKGIAVLSFVLLAAPFIKPDAALAGGFINTCVAEKVLVRGGGRVVLAANCITRTGLRVVNELNLSDGITNLGGNLSWGGGGFGRTCRDIKSPFEVGVLFAECGDGRGGWRRTELNLNERISNQNGVLAFDR
jgi:CVNH domain